MTVTHCDREGVMSQATCSFLLIKDQSLGRSHLFPVWLQIPEPSWVSPICIPTGAGFIWASAASHGLSRLCLDAKRLVLQGRPLRARKSGCLALMSFFPVMRCVILDKVESLLAFPFPQLSDWGWESNNIAYLIELVQGKCFRGLGTS